MAGWRQNLHRSHGVTFRQRRGPYAERSAECRMGRPRVWETGKSYGSCMELLWNNTLATRQQQAGYWLGVPGPQGGDPARGRGSTAYPSWRGRRESPGEPGAAGRRQPRQQSRPEGLMGRGTASQTQTSRRSSFPSSFPPHPSMLTPCSHLHTRAVTPRSPLWRFSERPRRSGRGVMSTNLKRGNGAAETERAPPAVGGCAGPGIRIVPNIDKRGSGVRFRVRWTERRT
jgi:hypothetical protein